MSHQTFISSARDKNEEEAFKKVCVSIAPALIEIMPVERPHVHTLTSMKRKPGSAVNAAPGFTRLDLVFTVGVTTLLVITGAGMTSRGASARAICYNNLRQLGVAAFEYADEHDNTLPPRRPAPNSWIQRLKVYYGSDSVVQCPTMRTNEVSAHSYLINAFDDYYASALTPAEFNLYMTGRWTNGMPLDAIPEARDTILFGEKLPQSMHVHMDLLYTSGNDLDELEHGRHFKTESRASGASNHTFADGSVRLLPYGSAVTPVNMWAIIPEYRTNFIYY